MPACCIVLITDETYLFPTFVSARQARAHTSAALADVVIFHMGVDDGTVARFAGPCEREGILLAAVDPDAIEGVGPMMARLFMNRFVPARYSHYLYLDGDVQIRGSLDPLIESAVPEGRFLAANDPMTFMLGESGQFSRELTAHMGAIGLQPGQASRYFNTGVLRINRNGWAEIGAEAWNVIRSRSTPFRFPDQDPLNIVAVQSHIPMSLAWNFPIFMCNAGVEASIAPRIYHYMSNPKPWQGAFQPWGAAAHRCYGEAAGLYPELGRYVVDLPFTKWAKYHLQQRYKRATEQFSWGRSVRRERILNYETGMKAARVPARPSPIRITSEVAALTPS